LKPTLDLFLALDMGETLNLEIPFSRIPGIVTTHGAFNVDRMSAVAFYQV
jgi:hypothetical protein